MPDQSRSSQPKTYAVVYQFGKVASTSLVAKLNQLPDVEAVQCHFMGSDALSKILQQVLDPETSEYFFFHQRGQLFENIEISRKVQMLRKGKIPDEQLFVLTLARNPFEWFRSALTQDAAAHLGTFRAYLEQTGRPVPEDTDEVIRTALPALLDEITALLESSPDMADLTHISADATTEIAESLTPACVPLAFLLLRPFSWFQKHFTRALGLKLTDLNSKDGYWLRRGHGEIFAALRYEDIPESFPKLMHDVGFNGVALDLADNVSAGKDHADTINQTLHDHDMTRLAALFNRSSYSQFFGYKV